MSIILVAQEFFKTAGKPETGILSTKIYSETTSQYILLPYYYYKVVSELHDRKVLVLGYFVFRLFPLKSPIKNKVNFIATNNFCC